MAKLVVNGATLMCDQGAAPSTLVVLPTGNADAGRAALATVADHQPNSNIVPFGMCRSLANPMVQSATAAAMGALTPAPCVPNTTTPWTPGSTRGDIRGVALLTSSSTCMCLWAGTITIATAGTEAEAGA